jgi:hypothetical protein
MEKQNYKQQIHEHIGTSRMERTRSGHQYSRQKERKLETNMSLYLKMMKVRTKDMGYKPEASTQPSYEACHYLMVIQKMYPTMIIAGEN